MKTPKLSKRLECAARMALSGNVIADVGCDHGLLPIKLVSEGRFSKAVLSDLREEPLKRAASNIKRYASDNADAFSLRLGSGLSTLAPGEADVVAVTGLSGLTIAEILRGSPSVARKVSLFVLQPNTLHRELRVFLLTNGYEITSETLESDGRKIYIVMQCRPGALKRGPAALDGAAEGTAGISALRAEFGDFIPFQDTEINRRFLASKYREAVNIKKQIENAPDASFHAGRIKYLEELTDGISRILASFKETEDNTDDSQ
ncbi:MAG: SAM-dependent methyltransferase [Clostridia bacterium]|nr:SAM-dependent methyltransferase [Clostridia bacterium]